MNHWMTWCILLVLTAEARPQATSRPVAPPPASQPSVAAAPAAPSRKERLLDAYRNTNQYTAEIYYQKIERRGRWRYTEETEFRIAYDRARGRLKIDRPNTLIVLDGMKLRMRSAQFKDSYLEIDAPRPLTYASLVKAVPILAVPELPDLMFLFDEDPQRRDPAITVNELDPDPDDPGKRPRLQFVSPRYNLVIHIEPKTSLISLAQVGFNPTLLGRPATDAIQMVHRINVVSHNVALKDDVFAFDVAGSTPVASLVELGRRHRLIGHPPPPIELPQLDGKPFKLGAVTTKVTVIHFWATWLPGHGRELAQLDRLVRWAETSSKSVTVVTVNLQETPDKIRSDLKKMKLTLPVLLASGDTVTTAYDAAHLPRTVIVAEGRVSAVLDSLDGNDAVLRTRIDRILGEQAGSKEQGSRTE